MPRYKLTIEYDGTGLAGWQKQIGQLSVQELLEDAIEKFYGERLGLIVAGRTDAGVHALGQVAHVDFAKAYDAHNIIHGINFHLLPNLQVVVHAAEQVADDFSARFSATQRCYVYRINCRNVRLTLDRERAWHVRDDLDEKAMQQAADLLRGTHDFSTFRDTRCQAKSPVKTLERIDVVREANEVRVYAEARSFLHHQVRNMVGSLRLVGNGKWTLADFKAALDAKDRRAGGETAPPEGLYLVEVRY